MKRLIIFLFLISIFACKPIDNLEDAFPEGIDCPVDIECTTCLPGKDNYDRWPVDKCVAYYYIDYNNPTDDESVRSAFAEWGEVLGMQFIETLDKNNPDIFIRISFRYYTEEEIDKYRNSGNGCQGEPLGSAPKNPSSSYTVTFNLKANWNGDNPVFGCDPISLRDGVRHELGHLLGLGHSIEEEDVMYCFSRGQTKLSPNDIARAKNILGFSCLDKFKRTKGIYAWNNNCLSCECQKEFDENYVIADWVEIKSFVGENGFERFFEMTNLTDYRANGWVTVNGNHLWTGNRHFFIERHDGRIPGGWLVHDYIGNHIIDLGSWYNPRPIVCVRMN